MGGQISHSISPPTLVVPTSMEARTAVLARIEELSSAISRQKGILRDLEISGRNARRDLNALSDPMAQLPFDISSEIFSSCIADSPELRIRLNRRKANIPSYMPFMEGHRTIDAISMVHRSLRLSVGKLERDPKLRNPFRVVDQPIL